jgi:OmpA-OmpF porin, OOP family
MKSALLAGLCLVTHLAFSQMVEITPEGHEIMSVYFAGGSYFVDDEQKKLVQDWLRAKDNLHEYQIIIHSHTDNIGSLKYNQYLSMMRSESVLLVLEEIMISREDVRVIDFGELNPLFDNSSSQGRLNNRRVDIILIPPSS